MREIVGSLAVFVLCLGPACAGAENKESESHTSVGHMAEDLIEAFTNAPYSWQQLEIASQIAELGDKSTIQKLEQHLSSQDRATRCNAGLALARLGDDRGFTAIIAELRDKSPRPARGGRIRSDGEPDDQGQLRQDRYYAAHVLGVLKDKRAIPILLEYIDDEDVNYALPWTFGQIGDKRAIPALREMLRKGKGDRPVGAAYGLARLDDPDGWTALFGFLKHADRKFRYRAADDLGFLGDARAVRFLIEAVGDEEVSVRRAAIRSLGRIGDPTAIPILEKARTDKTPVCPPSPLTIADCADKAISQINGKANERK